MLDLTAGDQIADDAILGCRVPDRTRAVLQSLETGHEPVLDGPGGATYPHMSWTSWTVNLVVNISLIIER